jgi:hypothetical protein
MGTTNLVQQMEGNRVVDILEALAMTKEIQVVTEKRFNLAQSAPSTSSSVCNLIGHNADTPFTKDLLQRKVPIPPDVDETTGELIEEMCCLWARLHLSQGPVDITPSIYKYYWGGSMRQHLWPSLEYTLGTGRCFDSQAHSST